MKKKRRSMTMRLDYESRELFRLTKRIAIEIRALRAYPLTMVLCPVRLP